MQVKPDLETKLRELVRLFLLENAKVNLSAFRTEQSCWIGNVLDSLATLDVINPLLTTHYPLPTFLDIGTGGGFPLLPLAIALPAAHLTGLDATKKKLNAVGRIATAMDIKNVDLLCGRAEALGRVSKHREHFDVVTSRAVADLSELLEYCSPFTKPGGKIVLWKSLDIAAELEGSEKAQRELKCVLVAKHAYELPGDFGKRQLLVFEKTGKLSDKYPRPVGVPKKKPVG